MLCQNCQQNTANVHLTQIKNNIKMDIYLCDKCAKEMSNTEFITPFGFNDLINGLFGTQLKKQETSPVLKCSKCGMDYNDFLKISRLGCSHCYETFKIKLDPVISRLHGNVEHHGKVPARVSSNIDVTKEVEKLKKQLAVAIEKEEYENAAKLRDRIRGLEGIEL